MKEVVFIRWFYVYGRKDLKITTENSEALDSGIIQTIVVIFWKKK